MRLAAAGAAALVLLAGCGGDREEPPAPSPSEAEAATADRPAVRRARCPAELSNCRTAVGRVMHVEAVDPDGDGDAHYVLSGGDITFPGISVIDVKPALRPEDLPEDGDWVSAAGPVYRGSFGQRQIEAVVVHHER
ncbi:MAG: hypothetical protein WD844_17365 [Thermoleophilaceae bacterium]